MFGVKVEKFPMCNGLPAGKAFGGGLNQVLQLSVTRSSGPTLADGPMPTIGNTCRDGSKSMLSFGGCSLTWKRFHKLPPAQMML